MLLIADGDRTGCVDMPVERLAARAGLTLEETREGLEHLGRPDPNSMSSEEEGRRIVPIEPGRPRGWRLVNWEHYRAIANAEQKREKTRLRVQKHRSEPETPETGIEPTIAPQPIATHTPEAVRACAVPAQSFNGHPRGLEALEIVCRTIQAIAPDTTEPDEIEVSLWLRDIHSDPWWLAAALCEATSSLRAKPRSPRYLRGILRRYLDEKQVFDDAMGYVQYFTSPQHMQKVISSVM